MVYSDNELNNLHKTEVEILDEIVRICNKFGLKYYLIGGTLLGAVRHQGFIPWDDDLDIAMPRNDYDKFISVCATELKDQYYLHDIFTDSKYWIPFAKIRKKGTVFNEENISRLNVLKGIYVDIFPLDTTDDPKGAISSKKTWFLKHLSIKLLDNVGYFKYHDKSKKMFFFLLVLKPFSTKRIYNWQRKLMMRDNKKEQNYYVNYGSNYSVEKQINPIEYFEPALELTFEGKEYKVPKEYRKILEKLYGDDYMQLPPVEKRITHRPIEIKFGENNGEV